MLLELIRIYYNFFEILVLNLVVVLKFIMQSLVCAYFKILVVEQVFIRLSTDKYFSTIKILSLL